MRAINTIYQFLVAIVAIVAGTIAFATIHDDSVRNIIGGTLVLIGWITSIIIIIEMVVKIIQESEE